MKRASEVPIIKDFPFAIYDDARVEASAEAGAAADPESKYVACSVAYHLLQLQFDVMEDTLRSAEDAMRTHSRADFDEFKAWIGAWPESVRQVGAEELRLAQNKLVEKLGHEEAEKLLWSSVVPRVERLRNRAQETDDRRQTLEAERAAAPPHPDSIAAELERLDLDEPTRTKIPEATRHAVWRRDQGRCVECGSNRNLEFDHIIPFSEGGSHTERNIQLLCDVCNRSKGARI